MRQNRSLLLRHLLFLALAAGIWGLYGILDVSCPIRVLTGIPCPTCGTTRALLSLLRGDVSAYLRYQPMAVFLVLSVLAALHLPYVKKGKLPIRIFLAVTLSANLVWYLVTFPWPA